MKRAVVLQHVEFEGPARIARLVSAHGYELDVRRLYTGDGVPAALASDVPLIVMGGPMGIGDLDEPEHGFLRREVELIEKHLAQDGPVLGVCLGAQLLAYAAGAAVYPMCSEETRARVYEVGWSPTTFHVGRHELLAGMPRQAYMLHWHGDTFDLPKGAQLLASTAVCRNQAFALGRRQLGLQFHCEVDAAHVEDFLRVDGDFVVKANGVAGIEPVRIDTARYIDEANAVGDRLLGTFVQGLTAD